MSVTRAAISANDFKEVPDDFKPILKEDLENRLKDFRLYACVKKPDGDINFHFFTRVSNEKIAWDFWILDY